MGYTNYWKQKRDFTNQEWYEITDFYWSNLYYNDQKYSEDEGGQRIEHQIADNECIIFNGKKPYETFILKKELLKEPRFKGDDVTFNFCKTAKFPYDEIVWELLSWIKNNKFHNNSAFEISNDGSD